MNDPIIFYIDLFCGAGGTSTGIEKANANAKVIACVNHDQKAIESHKANHPDCLHFVEDIRDFNVVLKLKAIVEKLRKSEPNCIINIWASLECTNYSKAKGGLPRDADSRTLAEHLFMYLEELNPDYLYIENVREFMSWGPLDKNGRPISRRNGSDYVKWCNKVQSYGFDFEHRILNAADFGAYTSRQRYFGQFAKKGLPISWPEPTHVKNLDKEDGMSASEKKRWKPVKDVLDLSDEGVSIFKRKKELSDNTLKRIYAGLIKFVAGGNEEFMTQFGGGDPTSKVWGINRPTRTVTSFTHSKVKGVFLSTYYGNGGTTDIDQSCPTITTKDRVSKIHPTFLLDYQFSNKGRSIEETGPTIIARQDKKPLYIINCDSAKEFGIVVFEDDSEIVIKIKEFMVMYQIIDIKMRMLRVDELLRIQGFPKGYKLKGTKTDQKRFIGNAVEVNQAKALIKANYNGLVKFLRIAANKPKHQG
ncbi:MAG: DNA cytosine methyltransferase [Saonia sp.]